MKPAINWVKILDKTCIQGGWNFSSPIVLDLVIDPAIVDTAIALFALQYDGKPPTKLTGSFPS
jgi:hypothetical protein